MPRLQSVLASSIRFPIDVRDGHDKAHQSAATYPLHALGAATVSACVDSGMRWPGSGSSECLGAKQGFPSSPFGALKKKAEIDNNFHGVEGYLYFAGPTGANPKREP